MISSSLEPTFEAVQRRNINRPMFFGDNRSVPSVYSSLTKEVELTICRLYDKKPTMFLFQFLVVTSGCVVFNSGEEK